MKEIIVRTHHVEANHQLIGMLKALFPDVKIRIERIVSACPEIGKLGRNQGA
jgi:hypothetical protein